MKITCDRCGKKARVELLGIYHVMGFCPACFDWLWKLGR